MDGLSQDMTVACIINDYGAASRVYDRFLSVVEPGITPVETVFPLVLGKRKTGAETAPCAVEIVQELSHDMQAAVDTQDISACDRIYNRFLAERETGAVSRFFAEHTHDMPEPRQPQDEDWTRPRPRPPSYM